MLQRPHPNKSRAYKAGWAHPQQPGSSIIGFRADAYPPASWRFVFHSSVVALITCQRRGGVRFSGHGSHGLDHLTAKKIEIRESSIATAARQFATALGSLRQTRPVP